MDRQLAVLVAGLLIAAVSGVGLAVVWTVTVDDGGDTAPEQPPTTPTPTDTPTPTPAPTETPTVTDTPTETATPSTPRLGFGGGGSDDEHPRAWVKNDSGGAVAQ